MTQRYQGGFLIAKIHQLTDRIFARILKEANLNELNPAQGRIMFALWGKDNISINELSRKTQLSKSTLTSMLDRLEKTGFLKRIPSNEDRRTIHIILTDKNRVLQEKYAQVTKEMTEIFYNTFSHEEIVKFERSLNQILKNLIDFD